MIDAKAVAQRILSTNPIREQITLPDGSRIWALPAVASADDTLLNQDAVSGHTLTLTVANTPATDALIPTQSWVRRADGKRFKISGSSYLAKGSMIKLFLGDVIL
jgi:hypothetical protein